MTDDRLTEIEITLSRQEDLLDTLNDIVVAQQTRILALESLCTALAGRLQTAPAGAGHAGVDDRPPHY